MTKISCVLLVEDDPVTVFITLRAIKSLNFIQEIKVAKNADEALEFLREKLNKNEPSPELIFLDINMPGKDGFEFLGLFNKMSFQNHDDVVICTVTTSNHVTDIEISEKMGVDEYILKPLTKEKIQDVYQKYFLS